MKASYIEIQNVDDLKNYFHATIKDKNAQIYVSARIRKEWMLKQLRTIIEGRVYDINFKNKGDGVWAASLARDDYDS